jgi:glutamate racemase
MDITRAGVIGMLDSGIGGFSILRHVRALLPKEHLIYLADQAQVPYGPRPVAEIRRFSYEITRFLQARRAKIVVVACNTASAAALNVLRDSFPGLPFVGMEPAVKPGAGQSRKGRIGVLATEATFGSRRYANLMARYAQGVMAFENPCDGVVEQIEAGQVDGPETERILGQALEPMMAAGVDTLVLGCTHYPFVRSLIRRLVGPDVEIVDPAPAVAQQVRRVLREQNLLSLRPGPGTMKAYTTADPGQLALNIRQLLGNSFAGEIELAPAFWLGDGTLSAE